MEDDIKAINIDGIECIEIEIVPIKLYDKNTGMPEVDESMKAKAVVYSVNDSKLN